MKKRFFRILFVIFKTTKSVVQAFRILLLFTLFRNLLCPLDSLNIRTLIRKITKSIDKLL